MKKLLLIIIVTYSLTSNAQNYLISFTGTGASSTLSTVKIENLTKDISLTINGSDILHLTATTNDNSVKDNLSSDLKIYPNPMTDNSILEIYPPDAGNAVISVLDMTGKQISRLNSNLENVRQDFRLSGIKSGFYVITVKGNNYQFSGKLLSNSKSDGIASLEKVNDNTQTSEEKSTNEESKGSSATVEMAYTTGDRLKFTGTSGNYSTVKTDIPVSNKTISFSLTACTDVDNNNYPVVEIGTQVWMAENLKTTKYNDYSPVALVTDNAVWGALSGPGYCWYNNDVNTYKDTYGAIYKGYTADPASNGGKNVCPAGWHVPTDAELSTLIAFLTNNGYGYMGSGSTVAKSMAATSGWGTISGAGLVGNDQRSNNSTGFSALPGGFRSSTDGSFLNLGSIGYWWSSTTFSTSSAYFRRLSYTSSEVFRYYSTKREGQSIRCLKDN
jgi:uncharacterized protein (TIGR02145 family)